MITLNKNQQRQPFGGHHMPEMGIVVRGETFSEVVSKVRDLRIKNGHPLGDPEYDVLSYYAIAFPYMVHVDELPKPVVEQSPHYERWRHWIYTVWRNPPKRLITPKEASFRWTVCQKCPFNRVKAWKKSDESEELDRRAFMLRAGLDIPADLGFCSCHRADIGILSFIEAPLAFSAKENAQEQPKECWIV